MEKTLTQRQSNCIKIVLFGPESTGKTTLAKQLAAYFNTHWVPEYMRIYLEHKWATQQEKISRDDLLPIAKGQLASENNWAGQTEGFLFCDTNLLELQVYCEYYYNGWSPIEIQQATSEHIYGLYFLTDIDVPWEPDNLRDRPFDRSTLFRSFEAALKERNLPYTILKGTAESRLQEAISILTKIFPKN